jgi:hypothetical protein
MSTAEDSRTQGQNVQVDCARCGVTTKHTVERALDWSASDEGAGIIVWRTYQIIRCNGCDTLSFWCVETCSEDYVPDDSGNPVLAEHEKLYPQRPKRSMADELYLREGMPPENWTT